MSDIKVSGLSDLQMFMDTLAPKLEANVMRGGLRDGATKELLPEAQANLLAAGAVRTGELIAGLKVRTSARGGTVSASVVSSGKHAYIAKWIEYGVKPHTITAKGGLLSFGGVFAKSVQHPGFAARPFLRPALDRSGQAAVVAVAEYIKKRLATKEGLNTSGVHIEGDQ